MIEIYKNDMYVLYKTLGGVFNEENYKSAFERAAKALSTESITAKKQAVAIARHAGIKLDGLHFNKLTTLYGVLRDDTDDKIEIKHHHCKMSDQRLFAETLRILGDTKSLKKLINAFPNINFK